MQPFAFSSTPLTPEHYRESLADAAAGGYASFEGWVRDHNEGRRVRHLEYEAYGPMAERGMRRIGTEIAERWPGVTGIAIAHRVGRVEIGETSVAVVVTAAHRGEALAACAHGIERLKASLPVWKKEVFADGSEWRENAPLEEPDDGR